MPELPEVENVVRGLRPLLNGRPSFSRVILRRKNLRVPFPKKLSEKIMGERILSIQRRAKFLLFETENFWLISHLGMTGSWRALGKEDLLKHDHCILEFETGLKLAFHDPRRFGLLLLESKTTLLKCKWLKKLGVEPLDEQAFTGKWLFEKVHHRKAPIKNMIMDQQLVVGVGNIYASESLFLAGIRPTRLACKVTRAEAQRLVEKIREVLMIAIEHGGSTINDYRNAEGGEGSFQYLLKVYDRKDKPCVSCGSAIRSKVIGGRSTYWCSKCQK